MATRAGGAPGRVRRGEDLNQVECCPCTAPLPAHAHTHGRGDDGGTDGRVPEVTATPQATSAPTPDKGTGLFSATGVGFGTRFSLFSGYNTTGGFSKVTTAGSSSIWDSSSFSSGWAAVGSSQPNQLFQKWSPAGLWARMI